MPPVIYQIIVAGDGRSYIGSASYFPTRKSHHLWTLRQRTHHCLALRRAVAKHGIAAISFNILEQVTDRAKLLEREQFWLDQHRDRLFNTSPTANPGASLKLTPDQKEAVRKFHTGRKRSAETRARLSAAAMGNTKGSATRIEVCNRGHAMSGDNLYQYFNGRRTARWCRQCAIDRSRHSRRKRRGPMQFMSVDTESSGLFDYKRSADAEGQPRLAQLAMVMVDEDLNVESEHNFYVRPDGWTMDPSATEVHGLTDEFLHVHGMPVRDVLEAYSRAILSGRAMIAHNAQHDAKMLRGELRRAGMPDLFDETKNICTMRKANGIILKADGKKGWPSLSRCREVLGLTHDGAHSAVKDALDALAVYRHLRANGVDLTPEVHHHAHVEEIRRAG